MDGGEIKMKFNPLYPPGYQVRKYDHGRETDHVVTLVNGVTAGELKRYLVDISDELSLSIDEDVDLAGTLELHFKG